MDLREAWRIAKPVEFLCSTPDAPPPPLYPNARKAAQQALEGGGPLDRAMGEWMNLRPVGAMAQEMAYATLWYRGMQDPRARSLMVALESEVTQLLDTCASGEELTLTPCYLDVLTAGVSVSTAASRSLLRPREPDPGMTKVAGSPVVDDAEPSPPPHDGEYYSWFYHRSGFRLHARDFRGILARACLVDMDPSKVEFLAVDAMRAAYRDLTEKARSLADKYRMESYESMQQVLEQSGRRNPTPPKPGYGWEGPPMITFPWGEGFPGDGEDDWSSIGTPFIDSAIADRMVEGSWLGFEQERQLSPATLPGEGALARLRELLAPDSFDQSIREEFEFEIARTHLVRILKAIADARINTAKVTLRQFIDWAAEGSTLSHASMAAIATDVARVPGLATSRFLGAQALERLWHSLPEEKRDRDRLSKALTKTPGTLSALETLK